MTGVTCPTTELEPKRLGLLQRAAAEGTRIALLANPTIRTPIVQKREVLAAPGSAVRDSFR